MDVLGRREGFLQRIRTKFKVHSICGLLGPRQVGKTTLAHQYATTYFPGNYQVIDLEDPYDLARLENPMITLTKIQEDLIVIDEIQRRPELFPVLRVLVDRFKAEGKKNKSFLVLGSASQNLLQQSSESLTGRIGYVELTPFSLEEVDNRQRLWLRGGLPLSYLSENDALSYEWRVDYIKTFLEQDISNLGFTITTELMRRFWFMICHYHGQTFNASKVARALMISDKQVQLYLDILVGTFMVRKLGPWHENIGKRQVRSSKVYVKDSGILHVLLGLPTELALDRSPDLGFLWEGFALEEIIRLFKANPEECFFWATHADAELDLLIIKGGKRLGFEFKYSDAPRVTKSMHIVCEDLKLDHLAVIYVGDTIFPLTETIVAYGLETIVTGEFHKAYPYPF